MKWSTTATLDLKELRDKYGSVIPWSSDEVMDFIKSKPSINKRTIGSIKQRFGKLFYAGRDGVIKPTKRTKRCEVAAQPLQVTYCPRCGCSFALLG